MFGKYKCVKYKIQWQNHMNYIFKEIVWWIFFFLRWRLQWSRYYFLWNTAMTTWGKKLFSKESSMAMSLEVKSLNLAILVWSKKQTYYSYHPLDRGQKQKYDTPCCIVSIFKRRKLTLFYMTDFNEIYQFAIK